MNILLKRFAASGVKMLHKNKRIILLFCVLFALAVLLGSTYSWFTSADSNTNILYTDPMKDFKITVVDVFDDTPQIPGDTWNKRVGAVNHAENPGFVRLLVIPTIVAADGETVLPAEFGTHVTIEDLNIIDWIYGEDGYYYYTHVLLSGESTDTMSPKKNLFNTVKVSSSLPAEYEDAHLKIEIKCEAVGIKQWDYRMGWWGIATAPGETNLKAVDDILALLAQ